MGQSINLVPREVKTEQVKVKVVRGSSIITVLMLLVIAGVTGFFYYNNLTVRSRIKQNEKEIQGLRGEIKQMEEIEVVARNLDKKYNSIREVLDARSYYSMLMEQIKSRVPEGVVISEFILTKSGSLSIDGFGQTYLSISEFYGNLGNSTGDDNLFSNVTLNSVSFDNRDGTAKYSITTKFNEDLLKK